ncbi:hypothetical protein NIES2130_20500 [Scytonema sp. HK-05]|nr:hypothetical protein NIES2130_20500 [Scytonema sp. HK-05]
MKQEISSRRLGEAHTVPLAVSVWRMSRIIESHFVYTTFPTFPTFPTFLWDNIPFFPLYLRLQINMMIVKMKFN